MIPVLKKAAAKYQQQFEKHKAQAIKDAALKKDLLYKIKGKDSGALRTIQEGRHFRHLVRSKEGKRAQTENPKAA